MAHQDDSFWVAVFKKSPIIGAFMAVFAVIGGVVGGVLFIEMARFVRHYLCILATSTLVGLFVGLAIGAFIDTLININRDDDDEKRRRRRRRDY